MILFWMLCALLVAVGLAFVLPPLQRPENKVANDDETTEANVEIYRDQLQELEADLNAGLIAPEQYEQDRQEFERRLLDDVSAITKPEKAKLLNRRKLSYLVALAMPVAAVAIYLGVGHSSAMSRSPAPAGRGVAPPMAEASQGEFTPERIEANVAALAKKLEQNPNDGQGWIMLARSYSSLNRFTEASAAYKKATELKPDDADLLANYAFTLAMANGGNFTGEPRELINRALKLDPDSGVALELAGSAAFEAGEYQRAIECWEKLLQKSPEDSELRQAITERLNEAKARLAKR
jgi:cytochrome c-type biogenesis protein CcmH